MARNETGASVVEEGLCSIRWRVGCTVEAGVAFARAEHAARTRVTELAAGSLPPGTASRGKAVFVLQGPRSRRMAVDPEVSSAAGHAGLLGRPRSHARRYRWLSPDVEADILARLPSAEPTELDLDVVHERPVGLLGVVGDILPDRFSARSTTAAVAVGPPRSMAHAARARACSAWTSTTAIEGAA